MFFTKLRALTDKQYLKNLHLNRKLYRRAVLETVNKNHLRLENIPRYRSATPGCVKLKKSRNNLSSVAFH